MNMHMMLVEASTKEELADLIQAMAEETAKYRSAFYAAKSFIDSHAADPDITKDMRIKYEAYIQASKGL